MIHEFEPIARAVVALSDLKIISFGPRPLNFLACNAPIKQLYNLGVEIEENSGARPFEHSTSMQEMTKSLVLLQRWRQSLAQAIRNLEWLAQYELTLKDWVRNHKGYRKYVAIAGRLAGIPDTVWFRTLLCQQPSDRTGHSGIL